MVNAPFAVDVASPDCFAAIAAVSEALATIRPCLWCPGAKLACRAAAAAACTTLLPLHTTPFCLVGWGGMLKRGLPRTRSTVGRWGAQVENQLTSCERVVEYGGLAKEAEEVCAMDDPPHHSKRTHGGGIDGIEAPAGGAAGGAAGKLLVGDGSLDVEGLRLWYSTDDAPVLDGVTFRVRGGEKIGIVGRTGAGKSSLFGALLRMSPTAGCVRVSGVDARDVTLGELRAHVTVIPQDPVLFRGTVRENLDPFERSAAQPQTVCALMTHFPIPTSPFSYPTLHHHVKKGCCTLTWTARINS